MQDPKVSIKGGSEQTNHKVLKKDIGDLLGASKLNVHVTDNITKFFNNLDVVIEFGLEEATIRFVKEASKRNVAFVSGSTGLSNKTLKLLKTHSKKYLFFGLLI